MGNPFADNGRQLSKHRFGLDSDFSKAAEQLYPANLTKRNNLLRELVAWTRKNFVRETWDWLRCKRVTAPSVQQLVKAISLLSSSEMDDEDTEAESPIFLLATGWRSGSTLMQRILVTDPQVLLWGEPLGEMALLSAIAEKLAGLCTFPGLAQICAPDNEIYSSLPTSWIATLSPPGSTLRVGLRTLLTQWLGQPAHQRGFSRWGFKEVRLGAVEATLLHWLYPKAKFVLLSRNPYDCYLSLSDSGWHHLYHTRPEIRVDSAAGLARHWNRIALSWSELSPGFPAFRINYENVVSGRVDFRKLESWLGIEIKEDNALSVRAGATARRSKLRWYERLIISREAAAGIHSLGYSKLS